MLERGAWKPFAGNGLYETLDGVTGLLKGRRGTNPDNVRVIRQARHSARAAELDDGSLTK